MTLQLFRPTLGTAELRQIEESFSTGWIGRGRKVAEFEAAWAAHVGVKPEQVVAVNCATEGLFQICEMLALEASEESSHDWAIIPSIHFIGAANAIRQHGAHLQICDVDPYTLNPTLAHIQEVYTPYTQAVVLLHYGGLAQELDSIRQWCDEKGITMIEDAACAPATVYKGKAAGTWGHFGVWSFDAMKIMSTGDGGMVYCENPDDVAELRQRIYLGMDEQSGYTSNKDRWWEFSVNHPGRRAIMNDIAAGIGLEQLKKLPKFIAHRRDLSIEYDERLAGLVRIPPGGNGSHYFYWIQTPHRDALAVYLKEHGIYTSFRYYPLHWVFQTGQILPGAEQAANETLLLPLHQGMTVADVVMVCERVRMFFEENGNAQ